MLEDIILRLGGSHSRIWSRAVAIEEGFMPVLYGRLSVFCRRRYSRKGDMTIQIDSRGCVGIKQSIKLALVITHRAPLYCNKSKSDSLVRDTVAMSVIDLNCHLSTNGSTRKQRPLNQLQRQMYTVTRRHGTSGDTKEERQQR